jgi:hypothetical protein
MKALWEPPSFDWPLKPDEADRHKNKSQQKYAIDHPDDQPDEP